jgi:hypothetical protein
MTKTVHVVATDRGWAVVKGSRKTGDLFPTKKAALASARSILRRMRSGQIALHEKNGRITVCGVHGLPRIQKSPGKSSLGSQNIERAVSKLVRERFAFG